MQQFEPVFSEDDRDDGKVRVCNPHLGFDVLTISNFTNTSLAVLVGLPIRRLDLRRGEEVEGQG